MRAKNILVTGTSSGLGYATVVALSKLAAGHPGLRRIIVTTTSSATVRQASARLADQTGVDVVGLPLNLGSATSIASFAIEMERLLGEDQLHAISLNAGVQIVDGLRQNDAGHEMTMAVNQIGHLRLLFRLWDRIAQGARVVFVGSGTHNPDDKLARMFGFHGSSFKSLADWLDGAGDPQRSPAKQGLDRYANSKLANIMTALELARRVPPERIGFYAVDPGLMPGTGLARDHNWFDRVGWTVMSALIPLIPGSSAPEQSAKVVAEVLLGLREAKTNEGHYLDFKGRPAPRSAVASDPMAARTMLDQTLELLGVNASSLLG